MINEEIVQQLLAEDIMSSPHDTLHCWGTKSCGFLGDLEIDIEILPKCIIDSYWPLFHFSIKEKKNEMP